MSFLIDGDKLSEKYKTIWIKIKDLQNAEIGALPVYDGRYIKTKIRTYDGRVYTNFPECDRKCCRKFFILLVSLRGPGSYNFFPLLKLVFFLSSMSFHEKVLQFPSNLTYNNCCNEGTK